MASFPSFYDLLRTVLRLHKPHPKRHNPNGATGQIAHVESSRKSLPSRRLDKSARGLGVPYNHHGNGTKSANTGDHPPQSCVYSNNSCLREL